MDLDFTLRGLRGRVAVDYAANTEPLSRGTSPDGVGFPYCSAQVTYPAQGYDAVLGWVQLVRSDDNRSGGRVFEIDPLDFLGDLPHPFCWVGINPSLFDAPYRKPRVDMRWESRSFLCVPDGGGEGGFEVHALTGFRWGFDVRDGAVVLAPPSPLEAHDWDAHVDDLRGLYPAWQFPRGFRTD